MAIWIDFQFLGTNSLPLRWAMVTEDASDTHCKGSELSAVLWCTLRRWYAHILSFIVRRLWWKPVGSMSDLPERLGISH